MARAAVVALHGVGEDHLEESTLIGFAFFPNGEEGGLLLGRELGEVGGAELGERVEVSGSKVFVAAGELDVYKVDDPGLRRTGARGVGWD
jgi:hypothetical protein